VTSQIRRVSSPELFVGSDDDPRQILRVELDRTSTDGPLTVRVSGVGVTGTAQLPAGDGPVTLEVPLELAAELRASYGTSVESTVTVVSGNRELATDRGRSWWPIPAGRW
jgi:hypothetical protein